jgi:hypothetical protein
VRRSEIKRWPAWIQVELDRLIEQGGTLEAGLRLLGEAMRAAFQREFRCPSVLVSKPASFAGGLRSPRLRDDAPMILTFVATVRREARSDPFVPGGFVVFVRVDPASWDRPKIKYGAEAERDVEPELLLSEEAQARLEDCIRDALRAFFDREPAARANPRRGRARRPNPPDDDSLVSGLDQWPDWLRVHLDAAIEQTGSLPAALRLAGDQLAAVAREAASASIAVLVKASSFVVDLDPQYGPGYRIDMRLAIRQDNVPELAWLDAWIQPGRHRLDRIYVFATAPAEESSRALRVAVDDARERVRAALAATLGEQRLLRPGVRKNPPRRSRSRRRR